MDALYKKVSNKGMVTNMEKKKISVYLTEEEKQIVECNALSCNLPLSQYLVKAGLQIPIYSSNLKAGIASIACSMYKLTDTIEDLTQREQLKKLAGNIYGYLES